MKNFSVYINYFYRFSSIFQIFWYLTRNEVILKLDKFFEWNLPLNTMVNTIDKYIIIEWLQRDSKPV